MFSPRVLAKSIEQVSLDKYDHQNQDIQEDIAEHDENNINDQIEDSNKTGSYTRVENKKSEAKQSKIEKNIEYTFTTGKVIEENATVILNSTEKRTLKFGDHHEDVVTLKKNLAKLGFPVPGTGTDYFGYETKKRVIEFQEYYGVTEDEPGVVGSATRDCIDTLLATPFQRGKHHPYTVQLKKDLAILDFAVPGTGTDYYGENTENKIMEFQRYYNLVVNGIADDPTMKKIQELINGPMFNGLKRVDVIKLKEDLAKLGFNVSNNPTTYYGPTTEKKVKEFQKYYSVQDDQLGVAGTATLNKIEEILATPLQNGKNHEDTVQLKKDLAILGFPVPGSGTSYYGPNTEETVKGFQEYYGLVVNGIVDEPTKNKIQEILNSPLRNGNFNDETVQLKKDLAVLGFPVPGNGTNHFGPNTEKTVKRFQEYYGLVVNGIVDEPTKNKIQEILNSPLRNGNFNDETVQLKKDLAVLGFPVPGNGTNHFGPNTEKTVKKFQEYYGLVVNGIVDGPTMTKMKEILNSPLQKNRSHPLTVKLKRDLAKLGYPVPGNGTEFFGIYTEKRVKEFQRDYGLPVSGIADSLTLQMIAKAIEEMGIKIFLDPGHGGKDPGARGFGLNEKDVVLDIALKTAKYLTEKYDDVTVKLSRDKDVYIALEERSKMANEWGADFFISIHTNAYNGKISGFESYIHDKITTEKDIVYQQSIHTYLVEKLKFNDRGKKSKNLNVLRNTVMPAILFEFLFIDHEHDNKLLANPNYRDKIARTLADAIAITFNLPKK